MTETQRTVAIARPARSIIKRIADVTAALAALIVLSPVIAIAAVLIRVKLGSPVLFRQQRIGLGGNVFTVLKFRSMNNATDESGELLPDELRLTKFGRALRRTSIDELPQLLNVVRGDMSIVGPRPLLVRYAPRYTDRQMLRHSARPGITGWAQVNGRNALGWDDRFALDVWYTENWSLALDARIIGRTIRNVVRGDGISASGEATMTEFFGSEQHREEA